MTDSPSNKGRPYRAESTLISNIKELQRELETRGKEIEGLGYSTPQGFSEQIKKLSGKLRATDLDELSQKDLTDIYRDLQYIRDLKSSTIEGAKRSYEKWLPIYELLQPLSKEKRDEFFKIYGQIYQQVGGQSMEYKYDDFAEIIESMYQGEDAQDVIDRMLDYMQDVRGFVSADSPITRLLNTD